MMTYFLKNSLYIVAISIFLIILSYHFIDQPVVFWLYDHHISQYTIFKWLTYIPENILGTLIVLVLPIIAIRYVLDKNQQIDNVFLNVGISVSVAYFINNYLKFVFGRPWPDTWINHNLSLLKNHAYSFC